MVFFNRKKEEDIEDKTSEFNEREENTYKYSRKCVNCNHYDVVEIPFGTTTNIFLKDKKCGYCKCYLTRNLIRNESEDN